MGDVRVKFIDWFAGIGGFRRGMELAGHECVGFCEFDKFATASYISMHLLTDEQRKRLNELPQKKRQKEILKDEYRNGEWYANDVRRVCADDIPKADCWCFGFPCQDISVAGKQLGFQGNRSSLFFRVMYLIGQLEEENRPTYLFIENVKNLLSVNGGWDFARLLIEMEHGGYDAEWQVDEFLDDSLEDFDDESGISEAGYGVLSDYYPDVWEEVSDFGKISTGILDLYMLAFKLAMKQLRERNEL